MRHLEQRMDVLAMFEGKLARGLAICCASSAATMGWGLARAILGVAAGGGVMLRCRRCLGTCCRFMRRWLFPWRSALRTGHWAG